MRILTNYVGNSTTQKKKKPKKKKKKKKKKKTKKKNCFGYKTEGKEQGRVPTRNSRY